jgi:hypothetical protein
MRNHGLVCCLLLVVALVAAPWPALADCAADCVKTCEGKTGKDYEDCMVPCLQDCVKNDPPPVPPVSPPKPVEPPKDGGS